MDTFSNLFTTLRNAQLRKVKKVSVPYSQDTWKILFILEKEGYIEGCQIVSFAESLFKKTMEEKNTVQYQKHFPSLQKKILFQNSNAYKRIIVLLKYNYRGYNGNSVIRGIQKISKPGGRVYVSQKKLEQYTLQNTLATYILHTSKGILCDRDAKALNVGGELICSIF